MAPGSRGTFPSYGFHRPPLQFAADERAWRDNDLFLGQISFGGIDYYTSSLVYGYGETEDIPSGLFTSLVGGLETGETGDRTYYGFSVVWPTFTQRQRLVMLGLGLGGFNRGGRAEDGVLDFAGGGFSSLHRTSYGYWRHFLKFNYTLGINRTGRGWGLRLDQYAFRDLDNQDLAGDQRLVVDMESVLFTRLAILGFKMSTFGYLAGGFVGEESDPILARRFSSNLGFGIRFNNPRLVIPTAELRIGYLNTEEGYEPTVTFKMGEIGLFRRNLPSTKPSILTYR